MKSNSISFTFKETRYILTPQRRNSITKGEVKHYQTSLKEMYIEDPDSNLFQLVENLHRINSR